MGSKFNLHPTGNDPIADGLNFFLADSWETQAVSIRRVLLSGDQFQQVTDGAVGFDGVAEGLIG